MWLWLTATVVLVADIVTKMVATRALSELPGRRVSVIPGCFDFYLQENTGAAFSILRGHPEFITAFSVVAILFIVWWAHKMPRHVVSAQLAFGMIIGGAIGNLIDRVRLGYVVDFLHAYYRDHAFPTFNIADSGITIGITIFLFLSLFTKKLEETGNASGGANEPLESDQAPSLEDDAEPVNPSRG